jgi:hypothetical protein
MFARFTHYCWLRFVIILCGPDDLALKRETRARPAVLRLFSLDNPGRFFQALEERRQENTSKGPRGLSE